MKKLDDKTKKILVIVGAVVVLAVLLIAVAKFYPGGIQGLFSAVGNVAEGTGAPVETGLTVTTPKPSGGGNETAGPEDEPAETDAQGTETAAIDENGFYYDKDNVALYIHTYGKLPSNFMTKNEARALGWNGGSLEKYAPGKVIDGDYFGNNEGLLPKGVKYTECDIDTKGSDRGAKRIVFGNDGSIYYTDDHYESFTRLY
ncbi:MAG: ribonuclease [Clostridia bacterium]|nr:ribonuclease [Clostridia bacterium]